MSRLLASPANAAPWRTTVAGHAPGLALCALVGVGGMVFGTAPWLAAHGISALTLAILLGMVVGNSVFPKVAARCASGVHISKGSLLRLGVMLYGFRLTLQDVAHIGLRGLVIDTLVLSSTFALAWYAGTRWFKLDRRTAMLIGAGSSICGAAAVLAAEPVVRARSEQVAIAVGCVVAFGTLAIFAYPVLFSLNRHWAVIPGGTQGFGIYIGSTVHEVAQVVAAARSVSTQAADTAVIVKMVRVMMLAPFLMLLSAWLQRGAGEEAGHGGKITVPWFALGFIAIVALNSVLHVPAPAKAAINATDTFFLAVAMGALGVSTQAGAIRRAGVRPLLLGCLLFAWLVVGGALINHCVGLSLGA